MSKRRSVIFSHKFLQDMTTQTKYYRHVRYSREDMFASKRTAYSAMCHIKGSTRRNNRTVEKLKKTATAIRMSVSQLYVTFCGAAGKLGPGVSVC
jgi:hypothetical protein